jgi:hypothetical protein
MRLVFFWLYWQYCSPLNTDSLWPWSFLHPHLQWRGCAMPQCRVGAWHVRVCLRTSSRKWKYGMLLVCVCVCFLAFVAEHAILRMWSVSCLDLPYSYLYMLCHKRHKSNKSVWRLGLVFLCSKRLPEDGTWVSKHVGFDTYHEFYFMVRILFNLPNAFVGERVAR